MKTKGVIASSMVLAGSLLTTYNGVGRGWAATIVALIGFVIFMIGLSKFKPELDEKGKGAIGLLFIAAIIGIVAMFVGLLPLIGGILSFLILIAVVVLQIIGYSKLKGSTSIGTEGISGANLLLLSIVVLFIGAVFGLIPGLGRFIEPLFALGALFMIVFGWLRIQKGFIGETTMNAHSISYILAGMLLQLGSTAASGWGTSVAAGLGFVMFLLGLTKLRDTLDQVGKAAVQLILIAVYIGLAASVIDFFASLSVPDPTSFFKAPEPSIWERIASLAFIASFVVSLIGFIKFKESELLDDNGKSGVNMIIISMGLAIAASIFTGLLPFGGGFVATVFGVGGLFLVLFGWLNIQEALAEKI
ncbi:MAG: hypothetical protein EA361_01470 [Bacteroidetes bacterium]|nr:MAG: hypothetical protein EA361_01470 [Bacteroidota bacterium]